MEPERTTTDGILGEQMLERWADLGSQALEQPSPPEPRAEPDEEPPPAA